MPTVVPSCQFTFLRNLSRTLAHPLSFCFSWQRSQLERKTSLEKALSPSFAQD